MSTLVVPAWRLRWRAPELTLVLGERAAALAAARRDEPDRLRAESLVVFASNRLGRGVRVADRALGALRAAEAAGEQELIWRLRVELAGCARSAGAPLTGFAALRPVLEAGGVPESLRAAALVQASECLVTLGRGKELTESLAEADRLYGSDPELDSDTRLLLRGLLHAVAAAHHRRWGDLEAALASARAGLALLDQLRDPDTDNGQARGKLTLELVCALMDSDQLGDAAAAAAPLLALPVRAPSATTAGWLRLALATRLHLPAGRVELARDLLRDAADSAERHQLDSLHAESLLALAHVHEMSGELTEALTSLRSAHAAERRRARSVYLVRARLAEEFTVEFFGLRGQPAGLRQQFATLIHQRGDAPTETDESTGLLNRRGFRRTLDEAVGEATDGEALSLVLLDVSGLEPDSVPLLEQVFLQLAERVRGTAPERAELARVGGDELAVLLPGSTGEQAKRWTEELRSELATEQWAGLAPGHTVTVHTGVAQYQPGSDADVFLTEADHALLTAKTLSAAGVDGGQPKGTEPATPGRQWRPGQAYRPEGVRRRVRRSGDESTAEVLSAAWAQAADRWRLGHVAPDGGDTATGAGAAAGAEAEAGAEAGVGVGVGVGEESSPQDVREDLRDDEQVRGGRRRADKQPSGSTQETSGGAAVPAAGLIAAAGALRSGRRRAVEEHPQDESSAEQPADLPPLPGPASTGPATTTTARADAEADRRHPSAAWSVAPTGPGQPSATQPGPGNQDAVRSDAEPAPQPRQRSAAEDPSVPTTTRSTAPPETSPPAPTTGRRPNVSTEAHDEPAAPAGGAARHGSDAATGLDALLAAARLSGAKGTGGRRRAPSDDDIADTEPQSSAAEAPATPADHQRQSASWPAMNSIMLDPDKLVSRHSAGPTEAGQPTDLGDAASPAADLRADGGGESPGSMDPGGLPGRAAAGMGGLPGRAAEGMGGLPSRTAEDTSDLPGRTAEHGDAAGRAALQWRVEPPRRSQSDEDSDRATASEPGWTQGPLDATPEPSAGDTGSPAPLPAFLDPGLAELAALAKALREHSFDVEHSAEQELTTTTTTETSAGHRSPPEPGTSADPEPQPAGQSTDPTPFAAFDSVADRGAEVRLGDTAASHERSSVESAGSYGSAAGRGEEAPFGVPAGDRPASGGEQADREAFGAAGSTTSLGQFAERGSGSRPEAVVAHDMVAGHGGSAAAGTPADGRGLTVGSGSAVGGAAGTRGQPTDELGLAAEGEVAGTYRSAGETGSSVAFELPGTRGSGQRSADQGESSVSGGAFGEYGSRVGRDSSGALGLPGAHDSDSAYAAGGGSGQRSADPGESPVSGGAFGEYGSRVGRDSSGALGLPGAHDSDSAYAAGGGHDSSGSYDLAASGGSAAGTAASELPSGLGLIAAYESVAEQLALAARGSVASGEPSAADNPASIDLGETPTVPQPKVGKDGLPVGQPAASPVAAATATLPDSSASAGATHGSASADPVAPPALSYASTPAAPFAPSPPSAASMPGDPFAASVDSFTSVAPAHAPMPGDSVAAGHAPTLSEPVAPPVPSQSPILADPPATPAHDPASSDPTVPPVPSQATGPGRPPVSAVFSAPDGDVPAARIPEPGSAPEFGSSPGSPGSAGSTSEGLADPLPFAPTSFDGPPVKPTPVTRERMTREPLAFASSESEAGTSMASEPGSFGAVTYLRPQHQDGPSPRESAPRRDRGLNPLPDEVPPTPRPDEIPRPPEPDEIPRPAEPDEIPSPPEPVPSPFEPGPDGIPSEPGPSLAEVAFLGAADVEDEPSRDEDRAPGQAFGKPSAGRGRRRKGGPGLAELLTEALVAYETGRRSGADPDDDAVEDWARSAALLPAGPEPAGQQDSGLSHPGIVSFDTSGRSGAEPVGADTGQRRTEPGTSQESDAERTGPIVLGGRPQAVQPQVEPGAAGPPSDAETTGPIRFRAGSGAPEARSAAPDSGSRHGAWTLPDA
ncbi:diguanylate cyclase [Solihabitans fulvus]|uniref:Diguanylate cyclase n=1 Tax=Solihabitans fulvus TaxID=1892852 RepID=A0A5B2XMZ3_9PSEU|nr:diguanylate cyclase [Solihabitans fulvus]KAA2265238.1 diguanylate cyclase [Solihabitans fulvus]